MEKSKLKKMRTIQITYPAPYSQSWNTDTAPVLTKANIGRTANPKKESPRAWSQSYSAVRGPDPTAPHLKYGVFSNRRITSSRVPRPMPLKPIQSPHMNQLDHTPELHANRIGTAKKRQIRKSPITESPVFVFRTIDDKRYTRQLSLSEIMHVDITPKRNVVVTPSFCPSPNFKTILPSIAVAPSLKSPR